VKKPEDWVERCDILVTHRWSDGIVRVIVRIDDWLLKPGRGVRVHRNDCSPDARAYHVCQVPVLADLLC
jgi:hypothetical protein